MKADYIHIFPKEELLAAWEKDRALYHPDAKAPPRCLRCGEPLRKRLVENALSRALEVYICPECGMDEALRDASGDVLPLCEWEAVKSGKLAPRTDFDGVTLTTNCSFADIFSGPQKQFPLSNSPHPVLEIAYSRSDYNGVQWFRTWFHSSDLHADLKVNREIDTFQNALMALPEFETLWHMKRMCRHYAQPTAEPTEFNLYAQTGHLNIWLRLITRERDYNLYCHYFKI